LKLHHRAILINYNFFIVYYTWQGHLDQLLPPTWWAEVFSPHLFIYSQRCKISISYNEIGYSYIIIES